MTIFQILHSLGKTCFMPSVQKDLEIIALRSQLTVLQQQLINRKIPKPHVTCRFRQLWVLLSKIFPAWKDALIVVNPETVLRWHKSAFKFYWKRKTRGGRPKISHATIALIKRIHKENPTLSPEKIHERLIALSIADAPAPNTIAKYIREPRRPSTDKQKQSWQVFLKNHAAGIWSLDFAVVPTLFFKPLYVLLVIGHRRRKIEHFAVTANPTAEWMIQQIRNATPFGKKPKYLVHDNDPSFKSALFQRFLSSANIISKNIMPRSPWQNGICERLVGIVRQDLFDHIIPLNQAHLEKLLEEYVKYYNNVRTHQALEGETPVKSIPPPETFVRDTKLKATPMLGGLYHDYQKVA